MKSEILLKPGCSVAKVTLENGESITSEGGAMIAISDGFGIETTTRKKNGTGGIMRGIKRMLSGESFFLNHYTAPAQGGEIFLAPTLHGDIEEFELNGNAIIVQAGSYLASQGSINADYNWQGLKSVFSGEGLFWLNVNGYGKVLINAYGHMYKVEVDGEYIVDTGHIVAFDSSLSFSISKAGQSWMSSFLGGEGFVCRFKGKGMLWCQSHNPNSFGATLGPKLKPR